MFYFLPRDVGFGSVMRRAFLQLWYDVQVPSPDALNKPVSRMHGACSEPLRPLRRLRGSLALHFPSAQSDLPAHLCMCCSMYTDE